MLKQLLTILICLEINSVTIGTQFPKAEDRKQTRKYESAFKTLSRKVDGERMKRGLFYLSQDLPRRVLNWSVTGHTLSSLEEADSWIIQQLRGSGYKPEKDETKVRAFGRDRSKPLAHQYARPADDAPWTSVTAAEDIKSSGMNVLAVFNLDGIGVKSPEQSGHFTNVTRYTTPEGERLADLMASLNMRHSIGLEQSKYRSERPGDDDGSFINAGFPWSVLNIGSMPYGDPNYHTEGDTADKVDVENAELTVRLTLAAILYLDTFGRP